jgi:hypothetical protein
LPTNLGLKGKNMLDDLGKMFPMVDTTDNGLTIEKLKEAKKLLDENQLPKEEFLKADEFLRSIDAAREIFKTSKMAIRGERLPLWSTPRLLKEFDSRIDENKYYFRHLKTVETREILLALVERA